MHRKLVTQEDKWYEKQIIAAGINYSLAALRVALCLVISDDAMSYLQLTQSGFHYTKELSPLRKARMHIMITQKQWAMLKNCVNREVMLVGVGAHREP